MSLLLQPLQAGALALENRLVMPPMATAKAAPDGRITKDILDYYDEKTRGGYISLVIIEHSYVSPEGKAHRNQLSAAGDELVPALHTLADTIHRNGSKTVMQINHAGSSTSEETIGTTPVGPSAVPNPRSGVVPHEFTRNDIAGLIVAFRNAARRVKEAGFDGVEIHSAHGYLLNQFFSPLTNKRTDEYGGSVLKRIKLHLDIIDAVRSAVGKDFPILLRLGASDFTEGGATLEDSLIAAREFEKAGVSVLDISGGFSGYIVPGLTGQGYFAPLTEAIKNVVSIPVILTGGITEAQAAEELIAGGKADLIGVGREILKDSDWAKHAVESLRSRR
ncbi:MAG TPA: NADH:flavin oxidoreductase [Clostridia bacterium]|nr:NADH:flavin oxidoreductase [Clostridia bacterium]